MAAIHWQYIWIAERRLNKSLIIFMPIRYMNDGISHLPIKHNSKIKLAVGSEKDTLKVADLKWKIDGKEVCKGKAECEADLSKDDNYKIEIFAGADKVLKLNLNVYKKPIVVFENDHGFSGDYGFDEASFQQLQQAGDYERLTFNGTDYYIPFMTPLSQVFLSGDSYL
ncbi:MAG: hypothetical protein M3421_14350 [Bacteroidota bacterium]|nr:hypothetical protein [Bacteroidota bacterium]